MEGLFLWGDHSLIADNQALVWEDNHHYMVSLPKDLLWECLLGRVGLLPLQLHPHHNTDLCQCL